LYCSTLLCRYAWSGKHYMNPKYADKCNQCNAMKPFNPTVGGLYRI
jgi:hypothetical protein